MRCEFELVSLFKTDASIESNSGENILCEPRLSEEQLSQGINDGKRFGYF